LSCMDSRLLHLLTSPHAEGVLGEDRFSRAPAVSRCR
jgi:hypothetical protein